MYKKDSIITIILMILLLIISILFNIHLKEADITNFITFLTMYIGFMMTSFAIMSENTEIKKLNLKKDPEDKFITLNYRLANYFRYTFGFGLTAIALLLITNIFNLHFITSKIILSLVAATGYSSKVLVKIVFDILLNKIVD